MAALITAIVLPAWAFLAGWAWTRLGKTEEG
jgi:hypothetical protein